jgi:NAD+ diphosphatase
MIGFTAEHAGGEIRIDGKEIEDANWYSVDRLPMLPSPISIARRLVDDFLRSVGREADVKH